MTQTLSPAVEAINNRISCLPINKTKLAKAVQMKPELLRRSLIGKRKLTADELVRLCHVLEMDLPDFNSCLSGELLVPSNSTLVVDIRHPQESNKQTSLPNLVG